MDDLMFDMDKRRHTSFRFQNYQNFITDRPGKFVSVCVSAYRPGAMSYYRCTSKQWAAVAAVSIGR